MRLAGLCNVVPMMLAATALVGVLGCSSEPEDGTLVLEVEGLLPGDTITVFASDKSGSLDQDFSTITFESVGNGTHQRAAAASTYHLTCPPAGVPNHEAYIVADTPEQTATLASGGRATFGCSYQTGEAVSDIAFADAALRDCVLDSGKPYTHAIHTLSCDLLNISSVSGIEHLTAATDVSLVGNAITDVAPFATMTQLFFLKLSGNQISQGVPALLALTETHQIWLDGNPQIPCADLQALIDTHGTEVVQPSVVEPGINCSE